MDIFFVPKIMFPSFHSFRSYLYAALYCWLTGCKWFTSFFRCLHSALLSSKFLNERLNLIAKVGCGLCVVGSTVIVIHSPEEQRITDMMDLEHKIIYSGLWLIHSLTFLLSFSLFSDCSSVLPGFIVYVCVIAIIALVGICYYAPKYGQTNVLVYIIICSVVGSLSVMACKGIGLAIAQTFHGEFTLLLLSLVKYDESSWFHTTTLSILSEGDNY